MELIHQPPAGGRPLMQGYGQGGFRVSGQRYQGSILLLPDRTEAWLARNMAELTIKSLQPLIDFEPAIELLIIGCGPILVPAPVTLRDVFRTKNIGIETMDTGAACRTYNLLAGEERRVAAALIGP
ncbi:MAG: Mth938-like domain-containing protein [Geminicoccaceae bacterium]